METLHDNGLPCAGAMGWKAVGYEGARTRYSIVDKCFVKVVFTAL